MQTEVGGGGGDRLPRFVVHPQNVDNTVRKTHKKIIQILFQYTYRASFVILYNNQQIHCQYHNSIYILQQSVCVMYIAACFDGFLLPSESLQSMYR